jgi:hypothetical protein
VNLRRSENFIFKIYGPYAFCRCLTRLSKDSPWRYKAGYSGCIIEKEVKVNIMWFRTLRSIEFQGICSRNWNLSRSKNCILGIYTVHKLSTNDLLVYQKTVNEDIQSRYSGCIIEKDVTVNIMRFRTLRSIEFQGLCSRNWNLARSAWKLYFWNLRSISFLPMPYSCNTRQSKKIKSRLFQVHNRKRRVS